MSGILKLEVYSARRGNPNSTRGLFSRAPPDAGSGTCTKLFHADLPESEGFTVNFSAHRITHVLTVDSHTF